MCLLVDTVCAFQGKTAHGVEGAASGSANGWLLKAMNGSSAWKILEVFLDGSHTKTYMLFIRHFG